LSKDAGPVFKHVAAELYRRAGKILEGEGLSTEAETLNEKASMATAGTIGNAVLTPAKAAHAMSWHYSKANDDLLSSCGHSNPNWDEMAERLDYLEARLLTPMPA
jgi:hypothetical protein